MKILISGSYGTGNVGDEVILHQIIQQLNQHEITVLSQGLPYTEKHFPTVRGVHQTPSWNVIRILKDICKFRFFELKKRWIFLSELMGTDIFIVGGGGLFSELRTAVLLFYCFQVKIAGLLKKKVIVLDVGIGPLKTKKGKKALSSIFNKYPNLITVRDNRSKENLIEIGVIKDIYVMPDPAFSYSFDSISTNQQPLVIFNFYPTFNSDFVWPGQTYRFEKLKESIINIIHYITDDLEMNVALLPFGTSSDLEFSKKILNTVNKSEVSLIEFEDFHRIANSLQQCHFSITMRFHAGLLSFISGRPSICIDQQFKSERLLQELNLKDDLLIPLPDGHHKEGNQDIDLESIKEKILRLKEKPNQHTQQINKYVEENKKALTEAFDMIKEHISESSL